MQLSDKNKIYTVNEAPPVKSFCPVCEYVARDKDDLENIQKENACLECTLNFKYLDLESWNNGLRPTKEEARSKIHVHVGEK